MAFDPAILTSLTRKFEPTAYLRCTPLSHSATPLGMGYGKTRFACPNDRFKLLYIAEDLATGMAETIVRDRFEGFATRELDIADVQPWGVCEIDARRPLRVLDLRRDGCFKLGVSTDIVGVPTERGGTPALRSQNATSNAGRWGRRNSPWALPSTGWSCGPPCSTPIPRLPAN